MSVPSVWSRQKVYEHLQRVLLVEHGYGRDFSSDGLALTLNGRPMLPKNSHAKLADDEDELKPYSLLRYEFVQQQKLYGGMQDSDNAKTRPISADEENKAK